MLYSHPCTTALLFSVCSVKLAGGRGMNVGYIYNESGELAISATQEALIRMAKPPANVTITTA